VVEVEDEDEVVEDEDEDEVVEDEDEVVEDEDEVVEDEDEVVEDEDEDEDIVDVTQAVEIVLLCSVTSPVFAKAAPWSVVPVASVTLL